MCDSVSDAVAYYKTFWFIVINMAAFLTNGNNKCPDVKSLYRTFSDAEEQMNISSTERMNCNTCTFVYLLGNRGKKNQFSQSRLLFKVCNKLSVCL